MTVTYDGLPAFDDTSCAMIGQRTVSGSITDWHTTFNFAWSPGVQFSFSRAGNRFQATAAEPLKRGDVLWAFSKGTRALSPSQTLTMTSQPRAQICGPADSAPLYKLAVTGPRRRVRARVRENRRFTLRHNRVDCPTGVPRCQVRVFAREIRGGKVREIGFRQYVVPGGSKQRVQARLFRGPMKRLARTRRVAGDVLVRLDVPPGDYRVKPILERIRVTLRAP